MQRKVGLDQMSNHNHFLVVLLWRHRCPTLLCATLSFTGSVIHPLITSTPWSILEKEKTLQRLQLFKYPNMHFCTFKSLSLPSPVRLFAGEDDPARFGNLLPLLIMSTKWARDTSSHEACLSTLLPMLVPPYCLMSTSDKVLKLDTLKRGCMIQVPLQPPTNNLRVGED